MKTLEQKIDDLIGQLRHCDLRTSPGVEDAKRIVRRALREQDRDTRHACAEITIVAGDPHDACMNCSGGLYP